jgi:hypothetical protein
VNILLAAAIVTGTVVVHLNTTTWTLKIEPVAATTQRAEWQDQLTPADALGIMKDMGRFGSTYFVEPAPFLPNASQR